MLLLLFSEIHSSSFQVQVDNKKIQLEVIDTAGQEEFAGFRDVTIHYGDGFLIIYSVDELASWNNAKTLKGKIDRIKNEKFPMVVCGNKKVSDKKDEEIYFWKE